MKENNASVLCKNEQSKSSSSPVQQEHIAYNRSSPLHALQGLIRAQIEAECFKPNELAQVDEIVMTIAEVAKLPSRALVRIEGNDIYAEWVAEIYGFLTHEHVKLVLENYARIRHEVTRTKTYRRTALYNSVFELESRILNQARMDQ